MFKKVNFRNLREDFRKIGVAFVIGGLIGLYLHPGAKWISFVVLAFTSCVAWYFGLRDEGTA